MKKSLLALLVIPMVLALEGCGIEDNFKADPDLKSLTGLLIEQKTTDKEGGTHFLKDASGINVPVRSLTINLSGDEYLNNRVQAVAMLDDADNVYEITGLSVLEILSDETPQNKLIEYRDTGAGFQLKYRDDWKVDDSKNGVVVFSSPVVENSGLASTVGIEQISFNYEAKSDENGLSDSPLQAYAESIGQKGGRTELNKIGVDGMDALRITEDNFPVYYLYRSGIIYKIAFKSANLANVDDENVFDEMLAEFRFVAFGADAAEPDSSADESDSAPQTGELPVLDIELTSFESLPYSFGGRYPAKWYYGGSKSTEAGVLHHYGFGRESVTAENEIISMDVLSGSIPNGDSLKLAGREFVTGSGSGNFTVYRAVDGQNYRVEGPAEYKDLILVMAGEIIQIEE